MSTRHGTFRNTMFSTVGVYTEYALGMLTSIVIARHLGPDGFGTYSAIIWMVAMGVTIANAGTASAVIKFVAELRGADSEQLIPALLAYLRRAQRLFMLLVLAGGAAVFVFAGEHVAPGLNHAMLLVFLVVAVALRASYMLNIAAAKGFENFRATAIVAMVSTPVNLALVVCAMWLDAEVQALLAVFFVSSLIFYFVSRRQVAPLIPAGDVREPLPAPLLRRMRRHLLMASLTTTASFFAASEVEVMFLNLYHDPTGAGTFKVAYQLATGAAMLVPGVFGSLLLPMMANALSRGHGLAGRRFVGATHYLMLLAAPLVGFGAVFSEQIIHTLYGHSYAAAGPAFALCLAGACITSMTSGGSSLLISADRQGRVLLLVIACALLKLGLDAYLIHRYGLMGGVVAYLTVSVACAIAIMALAIQVSGIAPDWGKLARVAAAAAVASLVALPLRNHLPDALAAIAGGLLLAAVYAPVTLLFGCWNRGDIEYLQNLHQRLVEGRPLAGARFLEWARTRASAEESA